MVTKFLYPRYVKRERVLMNGSVETMTTHLHRRKWKQVVVIFTTRYFGDFPFFTYYG